MFSLIQKEIKIAQTYTSQLAWDLKIILPIITYNLQDILTK